MEVAASSSSQPLNHEFPNYGCDSIELQGWKKFTRCLEERAMCFLHDPELQYVIVENVSTSDMEQIDYLRQRCEVPQMRVLYDEEKRLMIVKLIPGVHHHIAIGLFQNLFQYMINMSSLSTGILGTGSARFGELTKRQKDPDRSYVPITRFPNPDWPSVVLEVGVPESLRQLREDARYWLMNSDRRVLVVILISIGLNARGERWDARWERWEYLPSAAAGPKTRRQTRIQQQPTLMQTVIIPRGGPVTGAPFRIPSNKIWDIVPTHVGAEIVFTAQQLQTYLSTFVDSTV